MSSGGGGNYSANRQRGRGPRESSPFPPARPDSSGTAFYQGFGSGLGPLEGQYLLQGQRPSNSQGNLTYNGSSSARMGPGYSQWGVFAGSLGSPSFGSPYDYDPLPPLPPLGNGFQPSRPLTGGSASSPTPFGSFQSGPALQPLGGRMDIRRPRAHSRAPSQNLTLPPEHRNLHPLGSQFPQNSGLGNPNGRSRGPSAVGVNDLLVADALLDFSSLSLSSTPRSRRNSTDSLHAPITSLGYPSAGQHTDSYHFQMDQLPPVLGILSSSNYNIADPLGFVQSLNSDLGALSGTSGLSNSLTAAASSNVSPMGARQTRTVTNVPPSGRSAGRGAYRILTPSGTRRNLQGSASTPRFQNP